MKKASTWFAVALSMVILAQTTTASAANQTKVWLGTGLLTAGIALSARAIDDFCLGDGCQNRGEGELIAGVAMIGVGTFLLITGLQNNKDEANESKKKDRSYNQTVVVGFGPVRNGWAGAVRLRW